MQYYCYLVLSKSRQGTHLWPFVDLLDYPLSFINLFQFFLNIEWNSLFCMQHQNKTQKKSKVPIKHRSPKMPHQILEEYCNYESTSRWGARPEDGSTRLCFSTLWSPRGPWESRLSICTQLCPMMDGDEALSRKKRRSASRGRTLYLTVALRR